MITIGTNHAPEGLPMAPIAQEKPQRRFTAPITPSPGRPTVMTPDTLQKLKDAFSIDATVEEACHYAKISVPTFYNWKKENDDLFKEMEAFRLTPVLTMRKSAVEKGSDSYHTAMDYLSRKRPEEFGNRTKVEHAGKIETSMTPASEEQRKIASEYEERLRQSIVEKGKETP